MLYAPTWEGDAEYNDYTSLDTVGREVVSAILAVPDIRLVYKPHPKIATSTTPGVREAHPTSCGGSPRRTVRTPAPGTGRSPLATSSP